MSRSSPSIPEENPISLLKKALLEGNCSELQELLERDSHLLNYVGQKSGATLFHYAAQHCNSWDCLLYLYEKNSTGIYSVDNAGLLPIHYAMNSGNLMATYFYLSANPDSEIMHQCFLAKGLNDDTLLHHFARRGYLYDESSEVCKFALQNPQYAKAENKHKQLPLHWAAIAGDMKACEMLCTIYPEAKMHSDNVGFLPYDLAAMNIQDRVAEFLFPDSMKIDLRNVANVDKKDDEITGENDEMKMLWMMLEWQDFEELIVQQDYDKIYDFVKKSPQYISEIKEERDLLELFEVALIDKKDTEMCEQIFDHLAAVAPAWNSKMLHLAMCGDNAEICKKIIECDPTTADKDMSGVKPIELALQGQVNEEVVKLLFVAAPQHLPQNWGDFIRGDEAGNSLREFFATYQGCSQDDVIFQVVESDDLQTCKDVLMLRPDDLFRKRNDLTLLDRAYNPRKGFNEQGGLFNFLRDQFRSMALSQESPSSSPVTPVVSLGGSQKKLEM